MCSVMCKTENFSEDAEHGFNSILDALKCTMLFFCTIDEKVSGKTKRRARCIKVFVNIKKIKTFIFPLNFTQSHEPCIYLIHMYDKKNWHQARKEKDIFYSYCDPEKFVFLQNGRRRE